MTWVVFDRAEDCLIVGLISICTFGVTTFLFHFSEGKVRMEPIVRYAAFIIVMLLRGSRMEAVAASPTAALTGATISAIATWAVVVFVEWRISFVLGAGP